MRSLNRSISKSLWHFLSFCFWIFFCYHSTALARRHIDGAALLSLVERPEDELLRPLTGIQKKKVHLFLKKKATPCPPGTPPIHKRKRKNVYLPAEDKLLRPWVGSEKKSEFCPEFFFPGIEQTHSKHTALTKKQKKGVALRKKNKNRQKGVVHPPRANTKPWNTRSLFITHKLCVLRLLLLMCS